MSTESIVKRLKAADVAYYNLGKPTLTDAEYDTLRAELAKLEPKHPYLKTIGCAPHGSEKTLPGKMLSLSKKRPSDVVEFIESHKKVETWVKMPKFDGISCKLHYHDGRLVGAYTRGDGIVGRDVTESARYIPGIYKNIRPEGYSQYVEGRDIFIGGEVCMSWPDFRALAESDSKEWKHPRNVCGGMLNSKAPDPKILKRMRFIAFNLSMRQGEDIVPASSLHKTFLYLEWWGFMTAMNSSPYLEIGELVKKFGRVQNPEMNITKLARIDSKAALKADWVEEMHKIQSAVDIPTDGIVLCPDDLRYVARKGEGTTSLKAMIAVKPDTDNQQGYTGVVKEVEWNLSKRKVMKPTLVLKKPLVFDGVEVQRCTLNNARNMKDSGIDTGAKLDIIRSGDVIPWIRKVVTPVKAKLPKACPACGTKLEWNKSNVDLFCPNAKCGGDVARNLASFVHHLGIDWISNGTVEKMVEAGVTTIPKLLEMDAPRIARLPGFAGPSAKKLRASLDTALHEVSLAKLMHASGLFMDESASLGETRLTTIIKSLGKKKVLGKSALELRKRLVEEAPEGVGKTSIELFIGGVEEFQALYKKIGHLHTEPVVKMTSSKLKGQVVVFSEFRDERLVAKIREAGGEYKEGLTKAATLLVTANDQSTKSVKARERNLPIMSVEEFRKKFG